MIAVRWQRHAGWQQLGLQAGQFVVHKEVVKQAQCHTLGEVVPTKYAYFSTCIPQVVCVQMQPTITVAKRTQAPAGNFEQLMSVSTMVMDTDGIIQSMEEGLMQLCPLPSHDVEHYKP